MKVISIVGTRPEIIRTSRILPKLDDRCEHIIVHTNQNFTTNLKDIFYDQLGLRQPDIVLKSSMETGLSHTSFGLASQLADMFPQIEKVFKDEKPDKVFILGDTNSALCTIIAERMGIPVYHMEASNRSYNPEIPEEVNRKLIDAIASYNLFYTPTNRHTLLMEGHNPKKIFQCGNPTWEVLSWYYSDIEMSDILSRLKLEPVRYFLVDIHRSENINNEQRLRSIFKGLNMVADKFNLPVVCSIHPSTKAKMDVLDIKLHDNIKILDAFGFFDFVKLEKNALVGLTDSGLCSEEYCIMQVPCVILRNETERPEVVEAGGAIIAGTNADAIFESTVVATKMKKSWPIPDGYEWNTVSEKVVNYILSKQQ